MNRLLRVFRMRTGRPATGGRRSVLGRVAFARVAVAVAASLLVSAAGCERGPDAQTASPRAAAKAYAEAMTKGDRQALGQVSVGDDASLELLAAAAALNAAQDRLEQAAAARFGDARQVTAGGRGADHYAKILAGIDAAPEAVHGTEATVGAGRAKLYLKKVEAGWRVDRGMHVPPAGSDAAAHLAMTRAMTRAYDEVTDGLTSGAYPTAEAAKVALIGKMTDAIRAQQPAVTTTQPATTRPTTSRSTTERATTPAND